MANRGVDWESPGNVFWEHRVRRHESCRVVLEGHSAFTASDVTIEGDRTFTVPDGYHMMVSSADGAAASGDEAPGGLLIRLERIDEADGLWRWRYAFDADESVRLRLEESGDREEAVEASLPIYTC